MFIKERFKQLKALLKPELQGKEVYCNVCGSEFSHFKTVGTGNKRRSNSGCFACGSLERHRLLWSYMQKNDLLEAHKSLLHFGPEKMFYRRFCKIFGGNYYPVDLFPELYDFGGPRKTEKEDITHIGREANSFDLIICNHVLEHIEDDLKAMQEMRRVLKDKGLLLVQIPMQKGRNETYEDFTIREPGQRLEAFGQEDHVRWYGYDITKRFDKAGFESQIVFSGDIMTEDQINLTAVRYTDNDYLDQEKIFVLTPKL